MFDVAVSVDGRAGFDPDVAANAFRCDDRAKLVAECDQFRIVAYWPDQYDTTGLPLVGEVEADFTGERAVRMGGPGCPPVAEFAVAALAAKAGWSVVRMRYFLTDAVDARYRLPRLFDRVTTAQLPVHTIREVSQQTRDLSAGLADRVDQLLAGQLDGLSGIRLERRVAAAVITVDPERYARLVEKARRSRYFRRGQANEHGIVPIWGQLDQADAVRLEAMIKRIRTILIDHPGDLPGIPDRSVITGEEWDAIALGVLGDPIRAARLLIEYEQPDLFDDLVDLFTPPEDRPRTSDGPAPSDYPTNTPDAPADQADEAPVEEPPPDPQDADSYAEPYGIPAPVGIGEPVDGPDPEQAVEPDDGEHDQIRQPANESGAPVRDPEACGKAIRALLKAIPARKLLPPVDLHVHVAAEHLATNLDGPVRIEELGPTTLAWTRTWLNSGTTINLKPVIDPAGITPVDHYEIPERIREAVLLRNPLSRFPYSTNTSRHVDIDHTIPFLDGGPPGQTGPHDLGPLVRPEHRYKTFGPIQVRQPAPDYFVWRLDNHTTLIVGPDGTTNLGNTGFADAVWQCAISPRG